MSAKPVQVSIDEGLLREVDRDPDVKRDGRSAFVRNALRLYLRVKARRRVDERIRRAYRNETDELVGEIDDLIEAQEWPEK